MVDRLRGGYSGPNPAFAWVALYLELWLACKIAAVGIAGAAPDIAPVM